MRGGCRGSLGALGLRALLKAVQDIWLPPLATCAPQQPGTCTADPAPCTLRPAPQVLHHRRGAAPLLCAAQRAGRPLQGGAAAAQGLLGRCLPACPPARLPACLPAYQGLQSIRQRARWERPPAGADGPAAARAPAPAAAGQPPVWRGGGGGGRAGAHLELGRALLPAAQGRAAQGLLLPGPLLQVGLLAWRPHARVCAARGALPRLRLCGLAVVPGCCCSRGQRLCVRGGKGLQPPRLRGCSHLGFGRGPKHAPRPAPSPQACREARRRVDGRGGGPEQADGGGGRGRAPARRAHGAPRPHLRPASACRCCSPRLLQLLPPPPGSPHPCPPRARPPTPPDSASRAPAASSPSPCPCRCATRARPWAASPA